MTHLEYFRQMHPLCRLTDEQVIRGACPDHAEHCPDAEADCPFPSPYSKQKSVRRAGTENARWTMTYLEDYCRRNPAKNPETVAAARCRAFHFHDADNQRCHYTSCADCWNEDMPEKED